MESCPLCCVHLLLQRARALQAVCRAVRCGGWVQRVVAGGGGLLVKPNCFFVLQKTIQKDHPS